MAFQPSPILATRIAGLELSSPLIAAAGTAGVVDELADVMDLNILAQSQQKASLPNRVKATLRGA